ncbi:hypothetical protein BDV93DRAFT_563028 [Ceratobasidium sp. AG-I]|nr:hypothetical protein BDV93DRAFT_563028 [Ceratobasidium sp. AG-I]
MSLPDLTCFPNPASCNLAVAHWIHLVSQHPPWYVPLIPAPEPDSDDELQPIPPPVWSLGDGLHARAAKRVRSDSDLRPQIVRLNANRINLSPFTDQGGTRASTPLESVDDIGSVAPSQSSVKALGIARRKQTRERREQRDPMEELESARVRMAKTKSPGYIGYKPPIYIQAKGSRSVFHGYKCTKCTLGFIANQHAGTTETGGLVSHNNICTGRDSAPTLTDFIITGGTGKMLAQQVCEYAALCMAENAHAFQMINDCYLQKLFHPNVRRHLPHRDTVSKDIRALYTVTQDSIVTELEKHVGVFHIALDLFQSSKGYNFLGLVIFKFMPGTAEKAAGTDCFVLECLRFKIQDRVWGVVCDNASNNGKMMTQLQKFGLAQLQGPASQVHCVLHVYNLAAKAITLPFCKKHAQLKSKKSKGKKASTGQESNDEDEDEDEGFEDLGPDEYPELA